MTSLIIGFACRNALAQDFFPLKDVRPGMHGIGRTVFRAQKVEEFQVEILGLLENITPKQTVILARLSGGPLAETGILQGMSGSPVYIDGKLLGAVALGFPFSKETIAGIQPIEGMIASANRPASGASLASMRSVRQTWQFMQRNGPAAMLAAVSASSGLASPFGDLNPLLTPLSLSGFTDATLQAFSPDFHRLGFLPIPGKLATRVAGSADASDSSASPRAITPGSMISVGLLSGDLNMAADGTVTLVQGKRVYAFGHRFLDAGSIELPFARAEVVALIPSVSTSFKLSAPGEWVGTILSDRATAIEGEIGRSAHTVPLAVKVDSGRTGNHQYHFQVVNDRLLTPFITQTALFSVLDSTERSIGAGTLHLEGHVEWNDPGVPPLEIRDTFISDSGLLQQVATDAVVPLGFVLGGGFRDLHLKSMAFDISATETKRQLRIAQAWASPREVRPGEPVQITALLQGENGVEFSRSMTFRIPRGILVGSLNFTVSDGNTLNFPEFAGLSQSAMRTPERLVETINSFRDGNSVFVRVWRPEPSFTISGPSPDGEITDPPPSVALILADPSDSATSNAAVTLTRGSTMAELSIAVPGYVVTGAKTLQVEVKE